VQSYLQHYTETTPEPLVVPSSNAALSNAVLPLGPGTLTHNESGLRIIVVCSKADLIDEEGDRPSSIMVKGKGGEWEERTDAIMQVLRTICLKRMFSKLLNPISLISTRWCGSILHYAKSGNSSVLETIRSSSAVSLCPIAKWRSSALQKPIPSDI
jgi:hypothetical protein